MVLQCAEAESAWRYVMLLEIGGERSGRNAPCAVLEPCARANGAGLLWRKCEWHNFLGKH